MSIASELSALNGYILGAYDEINDKGGTVPANKNMANLASAIASISGGGGGGTITPTRLVIGGQSGAVEVKPTIAIDITNSLTSLAGMFENDTSVTSIAFDPTIDLTHITTTSRMCYGCNALTSVTLPNGTAADIADRMFYSCQSLASVSLPASFAPTSCSSMFDSCRSLARVTVPAAMRPTNCQRMFAACYSFEELPHLDTSLAANINSMFSDAGASKSVAPAVTMVYNFSTATNISGVFGSYDIGYGGRGATQASVDNILQSILTLASYTGTKGWRTIFSEFVATTNMNSSHLANLILNSPYYQDVVNAGWATIS